MARIKTRYSRFPFLKLHLIVGSVAATVILIVASVSRWSGNLDTLLTWSPATFSIVGTLIFIDRLLLSQRLPYKTSSEPDWHFAVDAAFALAAFSVLLTGLGIAVTRAFSLGLEAYELAMQWMHRGAPSKSFVMALTSVITGLIGGAFFLFRLKLRVLYGATEALAGIAVAAHRVSLEPGAGLPTETAFYFAVLTAGVYLVVRGLDNMHQGLMADDPIVRKLRKLAEQLTAAVEKRK